MASPEDVLADSPVDFGTAVAYALQPDVRRLIIIYLVGGVLSTVGLSLFVDPGLAGFLVEVIVRIVGLVLAVLGAALLFGGLIGALFKIATDANRLAIAD